jgi:hypothetical protein
MRMREEARMLGRVDGIDELRRYIEARGSEVWHFHCPVKTLADCDRIILRHSRNYEFDLEDIVDWDLMPDFAPFVMPIVARTCELVEKKNVSAIFIARLPAGKNILPHVDSGEFLELPSRLHVPIWTNPHVTYFIGGVMVDDGRPDKMSAHMFAREFHMKPGEVWEIDNTSYHSVRNGGDTDRWHLVMNVW